MEFAEYQRAAASTDKLEGENKEALMVSLLGLAGEAGSLLTLYKKLLRDGDAYQAVKESIGEELGDILWYVAAIARRANLDLAEVARLNLQKTADRWTQACALSSASFDEGYDAHERLPRRFTAEFKDVREGSGCRMSLTIDGKQVGNMLTDNSYESDGYRFHDVFHLCYATMLGWSPVLRANLKRKRKSNPKVDEVEDGGRAIAIEEGLSALIFANAERHSFFEGVHALDWSLLRTCHEMTESLEVGIRSLYEWEQAILQGYKAWRGIMKNRGGRIECDMRNRIFEFSERAPERPGGLQE
jgi:NTP pyrophosphatase (non-canonical NTP hydrolase)